MLRKYFLINIILISAAIFLGIKLYDSYAKPLVIPAKSIKKQIPAEEQGEKKTENPVNKKNDSSAFQVIVQKDLFRPSRTEPKIEEISKTGHPQALPPKLIGTVITESGAKAYLEDSVTKTTRAFGLKESVAGFIVHEIKENTVVLIKGEEKIELKITRVQTIEPPAKNLLRQFLRLIRVHHRYNSLCSRLFNLHPCRFRLRMPCRLRFLFSLLPMQCR